MNNYHYYLKSEFFPPKLTNASPRFSCVRWHPEKENIIYLSGEGESRPFGQAIRADSVVHRLLSRANN